MREIKFRYYDYREFTYLDHVDGFKWFGAGSRTSGPNRKLSELGLEQYTGLQDKNGKDIYESDLIKYRSGKICKVLFENGAFMIAQINTNYSSNFLIRDSGEIIGNTHENPELR